jgi:hypothetical protein
MLADAGPYRLSIRSGFPSRAAPAGLFMAACPGFIMAMVNDVFRRRRPTAADVAAAEARLERIEAELDSAELTAASLALTARTRPGGPPSTVC